MQIIKTLILEDKSERMLFFVERFEEVKALGQYEIQYDHVEHSYECTALLQEHKYDLIFLDHDLGGEEMVSTGHEDCGSRVVDFLVDNPAIHQAQGQIIVHSFNRVAAPRMAQRLKCPWVPGLWLKDVWKKTIQIK